jgi:hypothetical protein
MFNNLDFTKKTLYTVCEVFNECLSLNEIKHNIDIFQSILSINDNYTRLRIEWVLGLPQINIKYTGGSMPTYTKLNSKYLDKPINFVSPLLSSSNHDTILDQLIRMNSNPDVLALIQYLFQLIFSNPEVFNYFDNLPSPIQEEFP